MTDVEPNDEPEAVDDEPVVERRSIKRNLAHMVSSQLASWVLATLLAVVVPRFLAPETMGGLALAYSLWLIASIFVDLGTSMYLQLEISRRPRDGQALVGPTLVMRTLVWIVSFGALLAYAVFADGSQEFVLVTALVGMVSLLTAWTETISAAFLGLERMSAAAIATVVTRLVNVTTVVVYLLAGGGVVGVVVLGALAALVGLVQITWMYRRVATIQFRGTRARLRPLVTAGVPFMMASMGLVIYQQIDVIVISWVADREDLGWYAASDQLVGSLLFPATAVIAVVFPTLGRLHESDPDELQRLVRRVFSLLMLVAAPIALGTMIVAPSFAPVLYGEDYREVGDVLVALGPMIVVTFGTVLFGTVALTTERGNLWVVVLFVSAGLTIPLDLVLVPWADDRFGNGAIGGALAFVVTELLQFIIGLVVVVPFLATWSTLWRFVRVLLAGGVMAAATWPFREYFVVVPAAIGALVYAVAVIGFRVLDSDERELLRTTLRRGG